MKAKKILSSALVVAMIFTMLVCLIPPMQASAAHSSMMPVASKNAEQIKSDVLADLKNYSYSSAMEMLLDEYEKGYLVSVNSTGNVYSIYVNIYTGYMYYVNNKTGQVLTSNPYNLNGQSYSDTNGKQLASQIEINYKVITTDNEGYLYSITDAAARGQLDVSYISGGLRVNYTLGDTSTRYLVPMAITAARFEEAIVKPAMESFAAELERLIPNAECVRDGSTDFYSKTFYRDESGKRVYIYNDEGEIQLESIRCFLLAIRDKLTSAERDKIKDIYTQYQQVFTRYTANSSKIHAKYPDRLQKFYEECPLGETGVTIYTFPKPTDNFTNIIATETFVKTYCPEYTFDQLYSDEDEVGYVYKTDAINAVFRCAIEYSFNEDGSLCVTLPASSISFDETVFNLISITPLKYFGASSNSNDGYAFIPDGSGAVIEFRDFFSSSANPNLSLEMYGKDFSYSTIEGAHKEQVTMPVYGLIDTKGENATGYFAILERGESLASLNFTLDNMLMYGNTYTTFNPYPSDIINLNNAGVESSFSMVSDSIYAGSYVTRYVMLSGEEASYSGMAAYYREYLKGNGTLSALEDLNEDLPLYIEALGSVEVLEKVLSVPVNVDKALTTFDDIVTMYDRLLSARKEFKAEMEKYEKLAAEAEPGSDTQKLCQQKAEHYAALIDTLNGNGEISDIKNVNFKLTGFANGGMYATYPAKVSWMNSLGGKKGLESLISAANDRNSTEGQNMSIYPEFDFMYINYTAAFDGISNRGNVSRFVDNRYASKQIYNAVTREYESIFAMVINANALDSLYDKFIGDYSKYSLTGISASTLGSDLNSNFDKDEPVNRDEAQTKVEQLLDRISSDYSLMVSTGNIYSVKYADHILDMCIDSSHYQYASYTVPFTGMVLHSYVNYTGSALNYTGSPSYALLRAIENGASIYYILGYDNTEFLKEEEDLSKYYGGKFNDWYFSIVENYSYLNQAIGSLQSYEIVKHATLIAERVATEKEHAEDMRALTEELIAMVDEQVEKALNAKYAELVAGGATFGTEVRIDLNVASILAFASAELGITDSYAETLSAALAEIRAEYIGDESNESAIVVVFNADSLVYESEYDLTTESDAFDLNYDTTDYTVDNHLVTMVTYENPKNGNQVHFIINYNAYDVTVRFQDGSVITVGSYDYYKM